MSNQAYPLQWPAGRPRSQRREFARFRTSIGKARDEVVREVQRLCGRWARPGLVISSNLPIRNDGLPYANASQPKDSGVAVYFTYGKRQVCFACDRWLRIEDNLLAIAKSIEAMRGIARWGTGDMLEAAFTGFAALPEPAKAHWSEVLGVARSAGVDAVQAAYRDLARQRHPDVGGSEDAMRELNAARDAALSELGATP